MKVKSIRLLTLITGEIPQDLLRKINNVPTDVSSDVYHLLKDGDLKIEMIGTEARMLGCEVCGCMFDLDDDEEEEDRICSECGIGPMCDECLDGHLCEEDPLDD